MAAGTVATAAGAAVLLYYILTRRIRGGGVGDSASMVGGAGIGKKMMRRPAQAPATWLETLYTLSETLRFTYAETLGKWPIADLAFGINYLMRRQGNIEVTSIYGGSGSTRLKGPEIIAELKYFVRLLTMCFVFSKRPFPVFLELAGYTNQDVLLHRSKAGILKPAFAVIRDKDTKFFLLLIRGTHSMKDTLTAATGAVVPFHHSVLDDGGVSNLVLGYAHCGMVAAARWIAKLSTPSLLNALAEYPDYNIKVVGHSLGGGTAALVAYILREQKEFASTVCVTFAPAACMTWELAESGKHFITTVINGSDLVPTFSSASVDDLRSEVTASSWLNDLRVQVEQTRVLSVVYRSATALGSRLPSVASARAKVAGAGALLRPVSSSTRVVIKRAQDVAQALAKSRPSLASWSCMGPRRRALTPAENSPEIESILSKSDLPSDSDHPVSGSGNDDSDEDEADGAIGLTSIEEETEEALWLELEKEFNLQKEEVSFLVQAEGAADAGEEITECRSIIVTGESSRASAVDSPESQRFYPPGRILHVVSCPASDGDVDQHVALYETPRELYSKIRLSRTMIHDHYMPIYKKMIELLIRELEREEDNHVIVL